MRHLLRNKHTEPFHNGFRRVVKAFAPNAKHLTLLAEMGRTHLTGSLPAKNVGTHTAEKIEKLIALKLKVQNIVVLQRMRLMSVELDTAKPWKNRKVLPRPSKHYAAQTGFKRDAQVKAWVLRTANNVCECCGVRQRYLKTRRLCIFGNPSR